MFKIAVLPGDGIGTEIVPEALKVLKVIADIFGHQFEFKEALVGGAAYDACGHPLPKETLDLCKESDAVLLGAIGGPKWDKLPTELRPEIGGLLPLRKGLELYANLRPCILFPDLIHSSTLKEEVIKDVDILVIRELTGGIYFGEKSRTVNAEGLTEASDLLKYNSFEIERIARFAFEAAKKRRQILCSVDKANVLESSRLWREIVTEMANEYPDISVSHMYVDNCSMQLINNPKQFDVIVTENMFGDILTDEASMLTGSIGMLPSASIGGSVAMYEPAHGSAPDIAGRNLANPIATILSVAMMLRYSFNLEKEATIIEKAVQETLSAGFRTSDIQEIGLSLIGTKEMGDRIVEYLKLNV